MDLTRPVTYRGLSLNDASIAVAGDRVSGIAIDSVSYEGVEGVGYTEKRSLSDGFDAGDVYLGKRIVKLRGTVYGTTRADLFDRVATLKAALSPTGAYGESPGDYGYLPLNFDVPTENTDDWATGYIPQMVRVRPRSTPNILISRDSTGGYAEYGLAIPWEAELEARDPRIYAQTQVTETIADSGANSGNISVTNRGDYPAPLKMYLFVPSTQDDIKFTFVGLGTNMVIHIPDDPNDRIVRYDGAEKYLTLEISGVETLRMDLLEFSQSTTHPLVPAGGPYTVSWTNQNEAGSNRAIHSTSQFWFWEAFA